MAATLTKGLQSPSTKPAAIKTLTAFVEVGTANTPESARWNTDASMPPYLALVVTRASNPSDIKELLWVVGLSGDPDIGIWTNVIAIDQMPERNLLLNGVLAIIDFKTCEEAIQRHALVFFTHMAKRRPEVLLLMFVYFPPFQPLFALTFVLQIRLFDRTSRYGLKHISQPNLAEGSQFVDVCGFQESHIPAPQERQGKPGSVFG